MSWFRDTFSSVMGSSTAPQTDSGLAEKKEDSSVASVSSSSEWADGVNHYFSGVAASVSHQLAKDSGFAFVERFTSSSEQSLDAKKELEDLVVACKLLHSGSADPGQIWRGWLKKLSEEPPLEYYDTTTDDKVSFHSLLLRSQAVEATLGCIMRSPEVTKEEGELILDVFDRLLMGEREQKRTLLQELCSLSQNVDGTASHEQIERLVCEAVKQTKRDLVYEEAVHEAGALMKQVREREEELRRLPEVDLAALEGAEGGVGDEELKERVSRSAELLDRNASMRHLTTVARSMMEGRRKDGGALQGLKREIEGLKGTAAHECAGVKQRSEGTEQERKSIRTEADAAEQRLAEAEGTLAARLDELLARKRELEAELETVLGQVLSTDQQLNETRREKSTVARSAAARDKSLSEHLQALSVQTQDYGNELDALDELADFVGLVQKQLEQVVSGDLGVLHRQQQHVQRDQLTFVLLHLQNQAAQLQLLRSCVVFCNDELEATRVRSSKINKLGIQKMVSEEEERRRLLVEKRQEAVERVKAIEQDAADIRAEVKTLSAEPALTENADDVAQLISKIREETDRLDALLADVKVLPGVHAADDPPAKQPLLAQSMAAPPRPPLTLNTSPNVLAQSVPLGSPEPITGPVVAAGSPPIPPQPTVQELLRDSVAVDSSASPALSASAAMPPEPLEAPEPAAEAIAEEAQGEPGVHVKEGEESSPIAAVEATEPGVQTVTEQAGIIMMGTLASSTEVEGRCEADPTPAAEASSSVVGESVSADASEVEGGSASNDLSEVE